MTSAPDTGAGGSAGGGGAGSGGDRSGRPIYRIVWLPGSDRLRGYCWCGTPREAEDPVELWQWLLDHPDRHGDPGDAPDRSSPSPDQRSEPGRKLAGTPA